MRAGLGKRADWWMRRCVRFWSLSFAISRPEGIEEEVVVSWTCKASSNCAVYSLSKVKLRTGPEYREGYLRTRCSTHIHYLDSISFIILENKVQLTLWCGWTSKNKGGSILTASCLEIFPWTREIERVSRNSSWIRAYGLRFKNKKWMKLLKFGLFSKNFFRNIKLPCQSVWIPSRTQRIRPFNPRMAYHGRDIGGGILWPSNSTSLNAGTCTSRMVVLRVLAVLFALSSVTINQLYVRTVDFQLHEKLLADDCE